jgi:hypothetical protein
VQLRGIPMAAGAIQHPNSFTIDNAIHKMQASMAHD